MLNQFKSELRKLQINHTVERTGQQSWRFWEFHISDSWLLRKIWAERLDKITSYIQIFVLIQEFQIIAVYEWFLLIFQCSVTSQLKWSGFIQDFCHQSRELVIGLHLHYCTFLRQKKMKKVHVSKKNIEQPIKEFPAKHLLRIKVSQ